MENTDKETEFIPRAIILLCLDKVKPFMNSAWVWPTRCCMKRLHYMQLNTLFENVIDVAFNAAKGEQTKTVILYLMC